MRNPFKRKRAVNPWRDITPLHECVLPGLEGIVKRLSGCVSDISELRKIRALRLLKDPEEVKQFERLVGQIRVELRLAEARLGRLERGEM